MDSKIMRKKIFGDMIGSFWFLSDLSLSELLFSCGTSFYGFSHLIAPSLLSCPTWLPYALWYQHLQKLSFY